MNTKRLEQLISESKLSKQAICDGCGFSRPTLDNALAGGDIRISILQSLSTFFKVPIGYFFDEDLNRAEKQGFSMTESQQRTIENLSESIKLLTSKSKNS
jgi:transcriptional regulator with XRE-family HTH domain